MTTTEALRIPHTPGYTAYPTGPQRIPSPPRSAWSDVPADQPLLQPLMGQPGPQFGMQQYEMQQYEMQQYDHSMHHQPVNPMPAESAGPRVRVDYGRYWVGAALTAAVATLVGILAIVIVKDVFHRSITVIDQQGAFAVHVGTYALLTAVISIVTSALFLGIVHFAPRPGLYFAWIGALAVLFTVVIPFTMPLSLASQATFAGINLLVGVAIITLVPVSAKSSIRR